MVFVGWGVSKFLFQAKSMAEKNEAKTDGKEIEASYPTLGRVKLGGPLSDEMY